MSWTANDQKQTRLLFEAPAVRYRFKAGRPAGSDSEPIEWHLRQNEHSYFVGTECQARKYLADVLNFGGHCAQLFGEGEGI